ncbi:MAG: xanthine dehydrogenase family protein molybdopterin-binding subunit [Thermaerobacter sp.]|nr:xanthine dehydrogenase family protein molybdopterin-binding subunit [Thermaerobacter sp.]
MDDPYDPSAQRVTVRAREEEKAWATGTWVGQPLPRVEDGRLLRGCAQFIHDMEPVAGIRHAAILRSPHAHARIIALDVSRAVAMPGVFGVITGQDALRELSPFPVGVSVPVAYYPIAIDTVRYVGEPVAVAVAESRYLAEDALDAILVEYDMLPPVLDPEAALAGKLPPLHAGAPDNVANHRRFAYGDCDQVLAAADRVIAARFDYPRQAAMPIETYGVIASYDQGSGDYTVWANFHGPFTLQPVMAKALKVAGNQLRIHIPADIGGSFGVKSAIYPYIVLHALAAKVLHCPVKWVEDRLEHIKASSSASARISRLTAGVSREGRILALKMVQIDDVGAYIRAPEPATLYRVHSNLTGAYDIRHLSVENYAVMTNRVPTGLTRGYGGPQLYFGLERLVDIIARTVGLSPGEVRRRNLITPGQFPYRTVSGGVYDSGDYPAVFERALALSGYEAFQAEVAAGAGGDRVRYGMGMAAVVEPSGSNMGYVTVAFTPQERDRQLPKSGATAAATVSVDPSGAISVRLDSAPEGQGHETVASQIVADVLGVNPGEVRVAADLDTAGTAWSVASGSYSSRFAAAGASAVYYAAKKVRQKLLALAAHQLHCAEGDLSLRQGQVWRPGGATGLSLKRLAGICHWHPLALPAGLDPGLAETAFFTLPGVAAPSADDRINASATYGFLVDVAKVAVDLDTGQVRLLDYVSVHDAGTILNPLLASGQIYGGLGFGIGSALYEAMVYDDDGQLLTGTLLDYRLPTCFEVPDIIRLDDQSTPSPLTPLGAKGLGEGNVMAAGAAIANAVSSALGREVTQLPLTPQAIYALLQDQEGAR